MTPPTVIAQHKCNKENKEIENRRSTAFLPNKMKMEKIGQNHGQYSVESQLKGNRYISRSIKMEETKAKFIYCSRNPNGCVETVFLPLCVVLFDVQRYSEKIDTFRFYAFSIFACFHLNRIIYIGH